MLARIRFGLVLAVSLALVLPKLLLVDFSNRMLWGDYGFGATFVLVLQDLVLCSLVASGLFAWLRRPTRTRLAAAAIGVGCLLAFLMLDARTRELWYRHLDLGLIEYTLANASDLVSGLEIYLNHDAGFGMTFRRALFVVLTGYGAVFGLGCAGLWFAARRASPIARASWRPALIAASLTVPLVVASAAVPPQRYGIERNLFAGPLVDLLREDADGSIALQDRAARFELAARPLSEAVLAAGERVRARDARPFRNLVVIMLESVRWRGLDLDGTAATPMPHLRKLASEGLLARTYVGLPHTSKAYYSILTGRHPFPGLEMKEATAESFPSLLWLLRERSNVHTYAFSSMYLHFENIDGLLRASGVELRVDTETLADSAGLSVATTSSFGSGDAILSQVPPSTLSGSTAPFAALFLPLAAHYPYDFPGKTEQDGDGLESYRRSLEHADEELARLTDALAENGLLEDTLVVLVGDHGESFGEHGTFIHNNSMFEEEITVPLVLWSADGRLRTPGTLEARQIDVAPTVADLFHVADAELPVQGRSLLRPGPSGPAYITSFFDGVARARIANGVKHVLTPSTGELVRFDLESDPDERQPTIVEDSEEHRSVARQLRAFDAYQRLWFLREPDSPSSLIRTRRVPTAPTRERQGS